MEIRKYFGKSDQVYGTVKMEDETITRDLQCPIDDNGYSKAYLYIMTACSALGGFLFGYDTGVISGALLLMRKPEELDLTNFESESVVSSTIAFAIFGASFGGVWSQKLGRKKIIFIADILFIIGSLLMGTATKFILLLTGRSFVGLAVGLASMSTPMYISEISPASGQFFASITCGLLAVVPHGWRYMLGFGAVPAICQFISFFYLPESPRWLLSIGKTSEAKEVLQRLRGSRDIARELRMIEDDIKSLQKTDFSLLNELRKPEIRQALLLGCVLQALQQLAGINTVMYYGASILQMAGFTDDKEAIWLSTIVSFSNFFFSIVGMYCIDRIGRRILTLTSLGGVIIALVFLGGSFFLAESNSQTLVGFARCSSYSTCFDCVSDDNCGFCNLNGFSCFQGNRTSSLNCSEENWYFSVCPGESPSIRWLIFGTLFLYLAFFAPGMGSTPWTINSEIYPLHVRGFAIGIATSVNWFFNILVSISFISIARLISTYGIFWLYSSFACLGWLWLFVYLPETRGLRLEEIQELFQSTNGRKWKGYSPVVDHIDD